VADARRHRLSDRRQAWRHAGASPDTDDNHGEDGEEPMSWKHVSMGLAVVCVVQTWRGCTRVAPAAKTEVTDSSESEHVSRNHGFAPSEERERTDEAPHPVDDEPAAPSGVSINGFHLPAWTLYFAPMPGESMLSYRDRMLPIAQAALAPHRARVARGRDDFAEKVHLDTQQRAQLDGAVQEAASAIEDRVMNSLLSGQLTPATFKPMTGVALARDVLDAIDKANARFMASLREDQRAELAKHPFDFADYLLFSARWEDALGVTN
jgi:hypothetical protein